MYKDKRISQFSRSGRIRKRHGRMWGWASYSLRRLTHIQAKHMMFTVHLLEVFMGQERVPAAPVESAPPKFWDRLRRQAPIRLFRNIFLLPLISAILSGMVIGRLANYFLGPKTYRVYVVGDYSDPSTKDMLDAADGNISDSLNGLSVKVTVRDDFGDPDKAAAVAEEVVRRSDVLMVVGHGTSTATRRALPIYLHANPPVPVVLTTDTNPRLYSPTPPNDPTVTPVFRLFPTDVDQAREAAEFISKQNPRAVWVIEDTGNPTYSHFLASEFLKDADELKPALRVLLWSTNMNLPPYADDRMGIDWVFFAGDWRSALVAIRQLRAMPGSSGANVLLSDAAVDKQLYETGGRDVEGVYLLFPLAVKDFNASEYKAVGEEALSLTRALVHQGAENFSLYAMENARAGYFLRELLGLRRVSDARRVISQVMTTAVVNGTSLVPGVAMEKKDGFVIRKDARFYVWKVKNQQFVQGE
jgi:ABC-type branched-subunit amino acid transport system substrate-binding protein